MATKFVDVVKELKWVCPELKDVPVYCGSLWANKFGPMFTTEELVDNIPFGIHLPQDIEILGSPFLYDELAPVHRYLETAGIKSDLLALARFTVLHEVGHYVEYALAKDKKAWALSVQLPQLQLAAAGVVGNIHEAYRQLPAEARADEFALTRLKKLYRPSNGLT